MAPILNLTTESRCGFRPIRYRCLSDVAVVISPSQPASQPASNRSAIVRHCLTALWDSFGSSLGTRAITIDDRRSIGRTRIAVSA
jgi:hypothetical protein